MRSLPSSAEESIRPARYEVFATHNTQSVLDEIEARLKPRGKIRRTTRSIWPHYCQAILSAAQFMSQFSTAAEFYERVDFFDQDDRARPALPMLLAREIDSVGFALACDFLKELGYPECFAQEALGHNSKATHRAYAKRALMKIPSLEDYEQRAAKKIGIAL